MYIYIYIYMLYSSKFVSHYLWSEPYKKKYGFTSKRPVFRDRWIGIGLRQPYSQRSHRRWCSMASMSMATNWIIILPLVELVSAGHCLFLFVDYGCYNMCILIDIIIYQYWESTSICIFIDVFLLLGMMFPIRDSFFSEVLKPLNSRGWQYVLILFLLFGSSNSYISLTSCQT